MSQHPGSELQGWIETSLMVIFIVGAIAIVGLALLRCLKTLRGVPPPSSQAAIEEPGKVSLEPAAPYRCC
jgi:hypothetical protein